MAYLKAKDFQPGQPKILAFRRAGETAPSQFGDPQVKWQIGDGDTLVLDTEPAGDIEREMQALGIGYGEPFKLMRAKTSHGGSRFVVERLQGDSGGHNVPSRSGSGRATNAPAAESQVIRGQNNSNQPPNYSAATRSAPPAAEQPAPIAPLTARLCGTMKALLDAMNEGAIYAARLDLELNTEDLRALAITALIQDAKGGAR